MHLLQRDNLRRWRNQWGEQLLGRKLGIAVGEHTAPEGMDQTRYTLQDWSGEADPDIVAAGLQLFLLSGLFLVLSTAVARGPETPYIAL